MSSAGFRAGRIQVLSVLVISLLFTIFLFPTVARATDRVDTVINSDWKFHKGDVADAHQSGYDDSLWDTVDVPHTWNALDGEDGGNDYYRGIGWYRKHHLISNTYLGQRLFLFFEAVGRTADVYVNGAYVGSHEGSYAAF